MRSYLNLSRDEEEHALSLHRESVVIDASIVPFIHYVGEDIWIDDVLKGGVTATNATVCMGRTFNGALSELGEYHDWVEKKEKALITFRASDIEKAKKEGKHAIILGPQNSSFLEGDLRFLGVAREWGIRIIQLTYNARNEAGDGCMERCDAGLSNYGVKLVEEMNKQGVLIDLSHVGDRSSMEAIEMSEDPVSFTHVIPRSSTPREMSGYAEWASKGSPYGEFQEYSIQRGKTDEALQACSEKGGVIGVTPYFAKKAGDSTLTDDLMDQVDATVDLVGAEHVGFGSDLDFRNSVYRGAYIWKHPDRIDVDYFTPMDESWGYGWLEHMPNLTMGLVARGYSDQEIRGILSGNFLRLFRRVWGG
ncbi:MAG: membrane dipeptidase [Candidatus Bathyarchaeota archaeon]